ncbi:hypothetical protein P4C99_10540 [Pontiellaceae bacterium B1224]|nr:hypothetical protein [Pontiellaceae bacterium B1224]
MKAGSKKGKGVVKGAPSGFVISLMVHVAAFLLAGLLVVFNVVNKEEKKFVPPKPVERPKMKLKKPKVKVKKDSKPRSSERIVTKVQRANMPEIFLPEMSGIGDGVGTGGGYAGFDLIPDLEDLTVFGSSQSIGSDLEGTFYDFNRTRRGSVSGIDLDGFEGELVKFNKSGWKKSVIAKYYQSPNKLYTTTVAVPPIMSPLGPAAFGEPDNLDRCWIVLYEGKLVHKDGIKFRFVGNSDDKLAVRVDGKVVLDACREDKSHVGPQIATTWNSDSADSRKWYICHDYSPVGDLIELEPGVPKDIQIIIGEGPGTIFNAILFVKVEGVEYPIGKSGAPTLPVFKTAALTRAQQNLIYRGMPEGQVCVTNGPTFNDYDSGMSPEPNAPVVSEVQAISEAVEEPEGMRTWTSVDGQSFEAELLTIMAGEAVLKTPRGKQLKIPMTRFSDEDRRHISLSQPPKLKMDLGKKTRQRIFKNDEDGLVGCNVYTFSPKVEFSSAKYNHELRVDYWVIGSEISGSQYMLLDKGSDTFNPSKFPDGKFTFTGNEVELYDWVLEHIYNERRGERYEGFLITVTDERGKIIAERSTPTWLYKNIDRLKAIKPGSFFDDTCSEVWPTPLKVPANAD